MNLTILSILYQSVQLLCHVWFFVTPWTAACQASLSIISYSVMSDSLWPHGLQHARPPYPSSTLGTCSNSRPLSQWCHPTISSSIIPFSSHLQSFPKSGSFHMSQLFASGGQSTGVSASALVLPMNIQDWSPLGWTGWISLQSKGLSRVFSNSTIQKHQFFRSCISGIKQYLSAPNVFWVYWASLVAQMVKNLLANARDPGSVSGSGRYPGEGNGYSLQYSNLENSMDRWDWKATVHGVAKSQTQLSNLH